ncbi:MAG TPA: DUF1295 domain-containing protein [bacterium]|nr:DUF1295 domain-containing protein [bacterium]
MYGEYARSLAPKLLVSFGLLTALGFLGWILFGGGWSVFPASWGLTGPGAGAGRAVLFALGLLYLAKVSATLDLILVRKMDWAEAATIAVWVNLIYLVYGLAGAGPHAARGFVPFLGAGLFIAGAALNLASEWQRRRWKARPENKGRLYREGLFRRAVHINYFGENLSFVGFSLAAGPWWAFLIPALMAVLFIAANIPMLDAYLAKRYGDDFRDYAAQTPKFIPFLY